MILQVSADSKEFRVTAHVGIWTTRELSAHRAWLKPLKQAYNTTKITPISESRSGLVALFAT